MALKRHSLPVVPRSYSIFLKLDENEKFDGTVVIHLDIMKDTKLMIMSAKNLKVIKANLRVSNALIKPPVITTLPDKELIFLEFGTLLKFGWAVLTINYSGTVNKTLIGLYRQCGGGVATCRKPLSARNIFPCWDNPSIKSTFEISITCPLRTVLSNTPVDLSEECDSTSTIKFLPSSPMSVDQISICSGDYNFIEGYYNKVNIRVYTEPLKSELGRSTLDWLMRFIQYFSDFFDLQYPLPKLDAVIIDELNYDFMEGWGLLMLPSRLALVRSLQSLRGKKALLQALSQAVARQWIGNLITVSKLEGHALLKGCADYIGIKLCNIAQPELNPVFWFGLEVKEDAMTCYLRQKNEDECHSRDKISSLFYMIDNYMGEDNFKQGIKFYVQKYKFSSASEEQLWTSLDVYSKMHLVDIMNFWIDSENYPLITVKSVVNEGLNKIIELEQEPFHQIVTEPGNLKTWDIPVTFVRAKMPDKMCFQTIMSQRVLRVRLTNTGNSGWVKLNFKSTGFYRVLYPKLVLQEFISDFLQKVMSPEDRVGIIADMRAFVLSGREKTSTLLSFISQLGDEEAAVWWIIIKFFEDLFIIIPQTKAEAGFREYGLTVFKKIYNNLGWYPKKKEHLLETMLRPVVLKLYCRFEDSDALIEAKKRFLGLLLKNEEIEDDLLVPVFYGCARIGGEKEYNQLLDLYKDSELESMRDKIIEGLSGFQDVTIVKKLIEFLSEDEKRPYSLLRYLEILLDNEFGTKLVWDWLETNWKTLETKYSANMNVLSGLVAKATCYRLKDKKDEAIFRFSVKLAEKLTSAVEEGFGKHKVYRDWLNRDLQNIERFFTPWASSVST
ncbi:aminopeptidase M1-D-like [Cimex lectularius]|uniref:Aminopeptidase n=1 Tax=Cimex lectularius TaxID=79782 RepID=A0A8I6RN69_CIMLE|nr:aminopeptidase M1-D-like [Cimex lectularius]